MNIAFALGFVKEASMIKEAPFKSQAQRRKFYAMEASGEISKKTLKKWVDATPKGKKLPERVKTVSEKTARFAEGYTGPTYLDYRKPETAGAQGTPLQVAVQPSRESGILPWLMAGTGFGAGLGSPAT